MVKVIATNYLNPDKAKDAEPIFRELIAATRKEKGCIEYRLFKKNGEPGVYVFIEEWESQPILDKHMASEHFTRLIPQIDKFKIKDMGVQILEEFK
ncbi:putative quinol monooxygenase [Leadbettera azotonutricia]|nr:putative quinol monooxygenase [Leadbettera azotonutricia]